MKNSKTGTKTRSGKRAHRAKRLQLTAMVGATLAGLSFTQGADFHGLGDLPGGAWRSATGISADGTAVTGISYSKSGQEGFLWTAEDGMIGIGDLPGGSFSSSAFAISGDGSTIVGWSSSQFGSEAFRWTKEDGMIGLGDIPGGRFASGANDVSYDGSIISGYANLGTQPGPQAYLWTAETGIVSLGYGRGPTMSDDGSVIAYYQSGGAVRVTDADGTTFIGGLSSIVSRDGSTIVGGHGNQAYRWTQAGGLVSLDGPPLHPGYSVATATSADGSVIVGRYLEELNRGNFKTFIWNEESGMQSLPAFIESRGIDLTGWILSTPSGISADGLIMTGNGRNPDGRAEAWIADLRDTKAPVIVEATPVEVQTRRRRWSVNITFEVSATDDSGEAEWYLEDARSDHPRHKHQDIVQIDETTLRVFSRGHGKHRTYTATLRAVDAAGNISEPYELSFQIDKPAPRRNRPHSRRFPDK